MIYKKLSFLLINVFFSVLLCAQTYSFQHYTVQHGLPQSNVSSVIQDKTGYLWIGTESGLSRFDGIRFRNYTTREGLADNRISCMYYDSRGNLWMGHENGMLSLKKGDSLFAIKSSALPEGKKIFSIMEDQSGKIWLSTASKGAICIADPNEDLSKPDSYKIYLGKDGLSEFVFEIREDKKGTLFFLTSIGVKTLGKNEKKFEFTPRAGGVFQTCMLVDDRDNVWYGTTAGTIVFHNRKDNTFRHFNASDGLPATEVQNGFPVNIVSTVFQDKNGNIWAAIWDKGIARYDQENQKWTVINNENGLSVNKIKSVCEDREGNIILGTSGNGISVFRGERFVSFTKQNGLTDNHVWAIEKDNEGNFWFGTNEGISLFNAASGTFSVLSGLNKISSNYVKAIKNDGLGNMWIGTWGGSVVKFDLRAKKLNRVSEFQSSVYSHISCLAVGKNGDLWIGTPLGLVNYNQRTGDVKNYTMIDGLSQNDITSLFFDRSGILWIGTKQGGLSKYDGKKFSRFGVKEGLTFSGITGIAEGKNKKIWLSTEGGGVFIFDGSRFVNYRMESGLVSDYTTAVCSDGSGNMWIGTNNGLSKFEYSSNRYFNYSSAEGFTGIETKPNAVFRDDENKIWFGTVNGVFCFDPLKDKRNTNEPVTMITRLRVNLKDYPVDSLIRLDYKDNSLNIDFIGISFSNPEGVKYSVMMEGFDEGWKPATDQPFEVYSNLPPGDYTFKLVAFNSEGVESKKPVSFKLSILPPFWKTWWFYVSTALSGLFIIVGYVKWRETRLISEKKILEEKVEERTLEVTHKNRELAEKNKDIMDSIRYAKRIQDAILPPDDFVREYLPKTFILFKPKDIVSGDFYWLADKDDIVFFAAVDCTGHGVPGAFMSIVGHNLLEQIVNDKNIISPGEILEALNKSVSDTLRQSNAEDQAVKDGMDMTLCSFNRVTKEFQFAAAMNPLYFIRNGELKEIKGDKFPIGNLKIGEEKKFTNHSIFLERGDTLYIFSDGFADQFGGPLGKKYKYNQFKQYLLSIQHEDMQTQGDLLNKEIERWKGDLEQIDDILVIGTRL